MNIELKDYFAAKALQGLIAQKSALPSAEYLVTMSYGIAEKMIEQKNISATKQYVNTTKQIDVASS